mmetsp:Transcript_15684/g.28599  ORF Transcript_15684/g.28599 Transcript_15684/m.28599 type:complete len:466 (-) Transcript_15684:29-1426(-)
MTLQAFISFRLSDMNEAKWTWRELHANYNLLYILGLLVTFSSFFLIESNSSPGSFAVVTLIFRFGILFELVDHDDSEFQLGCLFISFTGNVFGALFTATLANKIGRKHVVLLGCGAFIIGATIDIPDIEAATFVARFFEGLANGLCTTVIPYIFNETLPLESRGTFGVTAQFMFVLGVVGTLTFSQITFEYDSVYLEWWQYAYIILIALSLILGGIILSCYRYFDTKLWLWSHNRKSQAREVIRRIYKNPGSVPQEATLITREVSGSMETKKPLLLGLTLAAANMSTGYFFYIFYAGDLISDQKFTMRQRINTILIHSAFTILGSLVSFFIVDRFNRKSLMFLGLSLMGVIQLVLGIVNILDGSFNVLVALISFNLFVYEATVAPLYWVYAPELMRLEDFSRNQVVFWSLIFLNSLLCYAVPETQYSIIILLFGCLSLSLAGVVWCFMIETRNKNWEQKYYMLTN